MPLQEEDMTYVSAIRESPVSCRGQGIKLKTIPTTNTEITGELHFRVSGFQTFPSRTELLVALQTFSPWDTQKRTRSRRKRKERKEKTKKKIKKKMKKRRKKKLK